MEIRSLCPLPSALLRFRPREGQLAIAVVCKATYRLEPVTLPLHGEQEPLYHRQKHYQDDPAQSVERPNDMVPFKPRAEVLLVGSAFVPRGRTTRTLLVRLVVGDVDKGIEIHGQRTLGHDGTIREGMAWSSMPLRYERAAGGPDTWNPVGVHMNWDQTYGTRALPQMVPQGYFAANPFAPIPPTGMGPLSNAWPIRRDKLGARSGTFVEENLEAHALGNDFDAHFFQSAPHDQLLDTLRTDERIVLENFHADHPRLVTSLPGLLPVVFMNVPGYAPVPIPMRPDTLVIDTERGVCTVTFRGQTLVPSFDVQGTFYVLMQEAGQTATWAQVQAVLQAESRTPEPAPASAPAKSSGVLDTPMTSRVRLDDLATRRPVIPFGQTPPAAAKAPAPAPPPAAKSSSIPNFEDDDEDEEEQKQTNVYKLSALQAPQAKTPRPRTRELPKSFELEQIISGAKSPLPFQSTSASSTGPTSDPAGQVQALPFAAQPVPTAPSLSGTPASVPPPPAYAPPIAVQSPGPAVPPPVSVMQRPAAQPLAGIASASEMARVAPPGFMESTGVTYGLESTAPKTIGEMHVQAKSAGAAEGILAAPTVATGASLLDKPAQDKPVQDKQNVDKSGPGLDLIWFEQSFVPRMRKQSEWATIVRPAPKPTVPQRGQPLPPPPSADAAEEAAKTDVHSILAKARAASERDVAPAGMVDKDAPLYLLAGNMTFPLDDIEMLKATAKAAAPLATADKKLKEVLDTVEEVLKMPLEGAPEMVQSFIVKVRDAWTSANKMFPPDYLVSHTERTLLNQRQYQKREFLDEEWIRTLWSTGDGTSIPTYIPAKLAKRLPLFRQFPARVIVEALPQQDMYETHPVALRVVALARLLESRETPGNVKR